MQHSGSYVYLLSFGSNVGERAAHLQRGRSFLVEHGAFLKESDILETLPLISDKFDTSDHGPYLNSVAEFESWLSPRELYAQICKIENEVGHSRERRWAPRALDIDILFAAMSWEAGQRFVNARPLRYVGACGLRIPHQGFWERSFLVRLLVSGLGIPEQLLRNHGFDLKENS